MKGTYTNFLGANRKIWIIKTDGTGLRQLDKDWKNEEWAGNTQWPAKMTQDGKKTVFISAQGGFPNLWTSDGDGKNMMQITLFGYVPEFTLTPDEKEIVFTTLEDSHSKIWKVNEDGSDYRNLSDGPLDVYPQFSPDNNKIVYTSHKSGNADIWIVNADGTEQKRLTDYPGMDSFPSFSPDGKKIVFQSNKGGNSDIWTMNVDGSNRKILFHLVSWEGFPHFSPNGKKVFFSSDKDGNSAVWSYDIAKHDFKQIALWHSVSYMNTMPVLLSWLPNGKEMMFYSKDENSCCFSKYILNVEDGFAKYVASDVPPSSSSYLFSPSNNYYALSTDGKKLAFDNYGGHKGIWVSDPEGKNPKQIFGFLIDDPESVLYMAWNHIRPKEEKKHEPSEMEKQVYHPENLEEVEIRYGVFTSWVLWEYPIAVIKGTGEMMLCGAKGYDHTMQCTEKKVTSSISTESTRSILKVFEENDFLSLKGKYASNVTDGTSVVLKLKVGEFEKTVDVYMLDLKPFQNITKALDNYLHQSFGEQWKRN